MIPLAPGRVSTTKAWPVCAASLVARMRAEMSGVLPVAFDTTIRTGRVGYGGSAACAAPIADAAARDSSCTNLIGRLLFDAWAYRTRFGALCATRWSDAEQ